MSEGINVTQKWTQTDLITCSILKTAVLPSNKLTFGFQVRFGGIRIFTNATPPKINIPYFVQPPMRNSTKFKDNTDGFSMCLMKKVIINKLQA